MVNTGKKLKVALVHDHLTQFGGAERVLFALHALFPSAPIYTLFYDQAIIDMYFAGADIRTSFLQKFPRILRKRFRYIAPLAVSAVENLDVRSFDLVISSSAFFAKGVITSPESIHICYCHTPTKYLWDRGEILEKDASPVKNFFNYSAAHVLRLWDFNAAARVDYFIANSRNVKQRIKKYYGKDAFVVYPPAGIKALEMGTKADPLAKNSIISHLPDNFYFIAAHLNRHKSLDLAVNVFSKLRYPLVIAGEGPERGRLKALAGKGTIFLGAVPDNIIRECYARCRALIHPGEEDFGISIIEAQLYGKPVLALGAGGARESVIEGVTGEFFYEKDPAHLADGLRRLNENYKNYNPQLIRANASRFNEERFAEEFRRVLKRILAYEWAAQIN